ncbi:120.5L [Yaba monkey tumor virus]|uniref:120.5L n=1 Tax=Yaba monkey tumor virus (strain VR587) TaxID=928314 RepID=Q6TUP9_YMTV5|nr:hypothetical protein YMTVg120.5L [Yaba monkey tumor virus]AAR07477.1 120.5L [Yaba monkey tumor virus]
MLYVIISKYIVKLFVDKYFISSKIVVGKFLIYMFISSVNNKTID